VERRLTITSDRGQDKYMPSLVNIILSILLPSELKKTKRMVSCWIMRGVSSSSRHQEKGAYSALTL
jgi:hypothetical protein